MPPLDETFQNCYLMARRRWNGSRARHSPHSKIRRPGPPDRSIRFLSTAQLKPPATFTHTSPGSLAVNERHLPTFRSLVAGNLQTFASIDGNRPVKSFGRQVRVATCGNSQYYWGSCPVAFAGQTEIRRRMR